LTAPEGAKVAVSLIGPFMVTVSEAEELLVEPEPTPVHEMKAKPPFGVASINTVAPAFCHPEGGDTVPSDPAAMVRKNCSP
jgi:hypothetical protein